MWFNLIQCKEWIKDPSVTAWNDVLCQCVALIIDSLIVLGFVVAGYAALWLFCLAAFYTRRLMVLCRGKRAPVPTSPLSPPPAPAQASEELRLVSQASCIVNL